MVSAVLSGIVRKDVDEEGVALSQEIGGGITREPEVEAAGLPQGEDLHVLVSLLSRCCTWIHKVTSGYI